MPATVAEVLKAGSRACLILAVVPALSLAQAAAAAQVLLLQVKELNALVLQENVASDPAEPGQPTARPYSAVAALVWTTNGNAKRISVTAVPPSEGLQLHVQEDAASRATEHRNEVSLATSGGHDLATAVARSSGRWILAYAISGTLPGSHIIFTITDS